MVHVFFDNYAKLLLMDFLKNFSFFIITNFAYFKQFFLLITSLVKFDFIRISFPKSKKKIIF
ncbi:MAG: hypothetical protein DI529_16655 [Chryseobacterium sp.]|nr:MAG: hypothetical protein DI529_16655 [Chryseobacterium sp.]